MIKLRHLFLAAMVSCLALTAEAAVPSLGSTAQCQGPGCDESQSCTSDLHCSVACFGGCNGSRGDPGNCEQWWNE